MINVRIANISPKVTKNLPNQLKTPRFKENFTIDTGGRNRVVKVFNVFRVFREWAVKD